MLRVLYRRRLPLIITTGGPTDTATTAITIGIAITGIIIVTEFGLPALMVVAGIIAIGEPPAGIKLNAAANGIHCAMHSMSILASVIQFAATCACRSRD